jgi:hypothetical protein
MSIIRRIAMLFRVKANKVLDHAEDPREVLDRSCPSPEHAPPRRAPGASSACSTNCAQADSPDPSG